MGTDKAAPRLAGPAAGRVAAGSPGDGLQPAALR